MKLGIIFGGISTEHDVSVVSATSIIKNLDKTKYTIYPIYISKQGNWYAYTKQIEKITIANIGDLITEITPIENIEQYLKQMDVIFPVLHGKGGEDGTIQGMLELWQIPTVGCGLLASSVGMDKAFTKILFEKAGIKQAPYCSVRKKQNDFIWIDETLTEEIHTLGEICGKVEEKLHYPVFIKPANSGSSVGIRKANNREELEKAILYAANYDKKILIEQNIDGKEVECAVLGNEEVVASGVGRILPAEDFYTFDAKYHNEESRVEIPANLPESITEEIRKTAIKAFKAIDGKGLSRVDFFVENGTNQVIINEINTMPGFTTISMYPKLWEEKGLTYSKLLDKLIELSLEKK